MNLGFTFYPQDWWTSETFFILNETERYLFLELIFSMYSNGGTVKNNKVLFENRMRTKIEDSVWKTITDLMVKDGEYLTLLSVNKRMKKAEASRENGKKGGRPQGIEKPKKPNLETQKNPPLETKVKLSIKETKSTTLSEKEIDDDDEIQKVEIDPNILETQNSPLEKIDSGTPSSFPALGHQPDRSYISNEYQTVKNTNVENAKSLLSDQHGQQRDAFMLAIGKNDVELFRYFLREFNAHRSRNGKEDETLNEYAKHLNNWINRKGTDGIKTMTIAYNQIKNPITKPKYGHYLYDK